VGVAGEIVVGHQLERIQLDLMELQAFVKNPREHFVISVFVKNCCPQVASAFGQLQHELFEQPAVESRAAVTAF